MGCLGVTTFTYLIATNDETTVAFQEYFTCHSFGIVPGLDCGDIPNVRPQVFGALALVSAILIGLIPLINLIFIVKWTCKCFGNLKIFMHFIDGHAPSKAVNNSLNLAQQQQ